MYESDQFITFWVRAPRTSLGGRGGILLKVFDSLKILSSEKIHGEERGEGENSLLEK